MQGFLGLFVVLVWRGRAGVEEEGVGSTGVEGRAEGLHGKGKRE